jgi:flavin-binding protein dodecin
VLARGGDSPAKLRHERKKLSYQPNVKDPVYKLIELTGTSTTSIEDAVDKAIKRAHKTIKNLGWFQVVETRGNINKGKVDHWQVTIKVGFTVVG